MIFKEENIIVYCKDDYFKKFDNKDLCYNYGLCYYRGYLIHRQAGPALEWNNGEKYWFFNGHEYSEEEYWKIINLKKKKKVLYDI